MMRDDDRDEQLEEAFDPQMDDPEPPGVDDREVGGAVVEQRRQIEHRDCRSGDQEERDEPAALGIAPRRRHVAPQQAEPEDEADGEQDLPGAADLEIFPALVAEPEPRLAQPLQDAGPFAEQAADRDDDDGGEQQMDGAALPGRLAAAQHAGDEQRTADIGGRDPQDGELQMPGAQQVARQERGQIDAVEVAGLGAVMRDAAADERLAEEQQGGDGHEFERGSLGFASSRRRPPASAVRRMRRRRAVPAEIGELAEGEQHDGRAGQAGTRG